MNIISPLQSIPFFVKGESQQAGQPQQLPAIEPGQLLKALVVEIQSDNRVLLQIGDNRFMARAEAPLQAGQTLQLQLVATSPQIELKVVNDTLQQLFGRSLTLVGNTINVAALTVLLQQSPTLFEGLSLHSKQALETFMNLQPSTLSSESGGSTLKQLIENIGLNFENYLSRGAGDKASTTLKSALLDILNIFKSNTSVTESAGKTLSTLEFFQLAQLHADSSQQLIFPLPLSFIEQGFLLIERRQEDEGGGKNSYEDMEYRFSLHLKMTDIGNLRVDFFHAREGLSIRFHADSKEKADFIAAFSDDLRKVISETPLLSITFAADAEDPAAELIKQIVPADRPVINTSA